MTIDDGSTENARYHIDATTTYREYTCCDEDDQSSRTKHGFCYEDHDKFDVWGLLFFVAFACSIVVGCVVCCKHNHKNRIHQQQRQQQQQQHNNTNATRIGSVQMVTMNAPAQMVRVTVPPNGVPGGTMLVNLSNGTTMQVVIPQGAQPGAILNVQRGRAPQPVQNVAPMRNLNVPPLPIHIQKGVTRVPANAIVMNTGGAYKQQYATLASAPRVVPQQVQQLGGQPIQILQPVQQPVLQQQQQQQQQPISANY